jgi:hypothetical protein
MGRIVQTRSAAARGPGENVVMAAPAAVVAGYEPLGHRRTAEALAENDAA